jgi:phosphoribosylglycinamide formyltransferase 1
LQAFIKKKLAIFASGSGSNAQKIIEYFEKHAEIEVALIFSNKKDAGVLAIAQKWGIDTVVMDRKTFFETTILLDVLAENQVDFIALAGFLWLVPPYLVEAFEGKMLNVHPALLPKYGGKGMFGHFVHEAVRDAREAESGPTFHFVNKNFDEGAIIFQAKTTLESTDTAEEIARKVLVLEHEFYPKVIEKVILEQKEA